MHYLLASCMTTGNLSSNHNSIIFQKVSSHFSWALVNATNILHSKTCVFVHVEMSLTSQMLQVLAHVLLDHSKDINELQVSNLFGKCSLPISLACFSNMEYFRFFFSFSSAFVLEFSVALLSVQIF